jgi:hypothetical protein
MSFLMLTESPGSIAKSGDTITVPFRCVRQLRTEQA